MSHIEHDPVYNTIRRGDFPALIRTDRYRTRSSDFDEIIARTNEHFWDPGDPDYIRFEEPWNPEEPILPEEMVPELHSAIADRLDERQKVEFINDTAKWTLSNILHGEQGALNLSSSLCDLFYDPGAQEYAANQVREEARHVHGFSNYMIARFGGDVFPVSDTVGDVLTELVNTDVIYRKIVGMQMLVEGVAMGAFATLHANSRDPLLRRLCQLTMTDEAFHHKFGKLWAGGTIPRLSEEEAIEVEDWALEVFNRLLFNLVNPEQKRVIYPKYGIDWQWAGEAMMEAFTDKDRRQEMQKSTDVFRTLIKTLLKAGIITERTRPHYAAWVDMKELTDEGDAMVGDEIAEEGIRYLQDINAGKRKIVKKIGA